MGRAVREPGQGCGWADWGPQEAAHLTEQPGRRKGGEQLQGCGYRMQTCIKRAGPAAVMGAGLLRNRGKEKGRSALVPRRAPERRAA